MVTTTARLELEKPDYTESADIATINANMDTIDGAVGVSIVNDVSDIPFPFNGQFAYELTFKELRFFINSEWLLVAAGDQNSGNPDRIRLPSGTLANLSDTTNAFQVGEDSAQNLAMDQNTIQSRNNEATSTLKLNENGGDVQIGKDVVMTVSKFGLRSDAMDPLESFDGTNISVGSTSFSDGPVNVWVTVPAPPSGKFLVTICARSNIGNSGVGTMSFECTRVSNGNVLLADGLDTNSIITRGANAGDNNMTTSMSDLVKGAVAGADYRFKFRHKKDAGGTNFSIDYRKILVLPVP